MVIVNVSVETPPAVVGSGTNALAMVTVVGSMTVTMRPEVEKSEL